MRKFFIWAFVVLIGLYAIFLVLVYFNQEKLLFHPDVILSDNSLMLPDGVNEEFVNAADGTVLNGALIRRAHSKGLIFYLHGNGGNAYGWAEDIAYNFPTDYDVFVFDYRGYGKSKGTITSEAQIMEDVTAVFDYIVKKYNYSNVIVNGYSIGTGPATQLAAARNVKALILQAPYYSLSKLTDEKVPFLPDFIKKHRFETHDYLPKVKAPVYLFHGTNDELIPFHHSELLKAENPEINLIPVQGMGHNGLNSNDVFLNKLKEILS
jgi:pimeloyl-ACP methyl ester carboxylesterase